MAKLFSHRQRLPEAHYIILCIAGIKLEVLAIEI